MTRIDTLADGEARRAIREDLDDTLVVEAAAGTGKTTEMIARIIGVIRTGRTTLERIVAVTFTEKAAGEMKLRLRTELERARKLAMDEVERGRLEAALAELEVARVGSIHSFCADVLRERPVEAKVDPLFEVAAEDASARIYQQAFEGWFQATLADPPEGVRRILRRYDPKQLLRDAGASLIEKRDFDGAWRRDPFERDAAIGAVIDAFATLTDLPAKAFRSTTLVELLTRLARWMEELRRREAVRPRDHDGLEAELVEVARWKGWSHKGGTAKQYGDGLSRVEVVDRRDGVRSVLEDFLARAEADLAALLREELRPLVAAYEQRKARTGRLDFLDLLLKTRDLIANDAAVRAEMSARFTHFFIDEFQDTDPLQVEILMMLASDPATGRITPGKLFVVGDPKQAIYRFRRADVAIYEAVKAKLIAQGARLVDLVTSFRAVPQIQSAVNAAFAPVMQGDTQARYVPLAQHRDDIAGQPALVALPTPDPYGSWGSVTNEAIEDSYPDAVAAFIAHAVHKSGWLVTDREQGGARVPLAPNHICLVFKRFQSFGYDLTRDYVRALEARGIPHVLVGGRSFHEREEVEALRNALAAIEWPDDELAVYATLRGPCFSFHDEDLLAFREAAGQLHPLQWIGTLIPPVGAPPEVAEALGILGKLHVYRNRQPIAATLASLLAQTRAHAAFAFWPAGEQALANVMRVIDLARRFEAGGASSFRAFVDKVRLDAERGRQPDAPVVEERTEGVRIMTVHAAKGLEFPVVILCDPTGPLANKAPSRHYDAERRVWLEAIARCTPIELHERRDEILQRDREEGQRLAYVAATRARDLLVVPAVGDEERTSTWHQALLPVIYPPEASRRRRVPAPGCPPFGDDSVRKRPNNVQRGVDASVVPGLHAPRTGSHRVVWWDWRTLELDRVLESGMRQRQLLQLDDSGELAAASTREHDEWQAARSTAHANGATQSLLVWSITQAASRENAGDAPVLLEDTRIPRADRPRGKRFGSLVHATLAAVELRGDAQHVGLVAESQGRLVGASPDEVSAAVTAVVAALGHPLLARAAAAHDRGELRREVPVVLSTDVELLEGIVDLAFEEAGEWIVVDYKTDAELDHARPIYEAQVRLYAHAIATATGKPAHAALLIV